MAAVRNSLLLACLALPLFALPAAAADSSSFDAIAAKSLSDPGMSSDLGKFGEHHGEFDDHGEHRFGGDDDHHHVTPVPEPGTWAMMAAGLAGLLVARRRTRG